MNNHISIDGVLRRVFGLYSKRFATLIGLGLVVFIPTGLVYGLCLDSGSMFLSLIGALLFLVASYFYAGAVVRVVEEESTGDGEHSIGDLLSSVSPVVLPLIGVSILAAIGIMIGFVLLILPGIFLLVAWSVYVPAIVVERKGVAALGRSWELVKGNFWQVLGVFVVIMVLQIVVYLVLGMVFGGIGGIVGFMLIQVILGVLVMPISGLTQSVVFFSLRDAEGAAPASAPPAAGGDAVPPAPPAPPAPGGDSSPPPAPGGGIPPSPQG